MRGTYNALTAGGRYNYSAKSDQMHSLSTGGLIYQGLTPWTLFCIDCDIIYGMSSEHKVSAVQLLQ